MSNETTNPVVKWILIGICVVSVCVVGVLFLIGSYSANGHRAARELQARGFRIDYLSHGEFVWAYAGTVIGKDQSITEDDSRLIGQLSHLQFLEFIRCDLSELNLNDIGNCRELSNFHCYDVTPFPANEISKLVACPIKVFVFENASLNDSDLEVFAKLTKLEYLHLNGNTGITDEGFEYFEKITSLKNLFLNGTSVTKEGVEEFQKKRSDVEVSY